MAEYDPLRVELVDLATGTPLASLRDEEFEGFAYDLAAVGRLAVVTQGQIRRSASPAGRDPCPASGVGLYGIAKLKPEGRGSAVVWDGTVGSGADHSAEFGITVDDRS